MNVNMSCRRIWQKSDASIMLMVPAEVYDIIADRMEKPVFMCC